MRNAEARCSLMCDFLKQHKLQGWFSWRPEELVLQTRHLPHWGLSFLLFLQDGERILFVPELEPRDTIPADATLITYPWGILRSLDPFDDLGRAIQDTLERLHLKVASIGVQQNSNRCSLPEMAAEQPSLPPESLQALTLGMTCNPQLDASFLSLYLQKTESEIECIRLANQVALVGLDAWRTMLIPGVTEAESAAAAESAIRGMIGKPGIASASAWAMVQSGPNTVSAGRFNRSTGRRFESGDVVLIELATCVNGYWSDLTRTDSVGEVATELAEVLQAVAEAQRAAIATVRSGVSAHEVDSAARRSLSQSGFADFFTHGTGHHTGFRYHDPGFAIAPHSHSLLQSGMVITIEPGAYVPARNCGVRIEDNLVVTEKGANILSFRKDVVLDRH